MAVSVASLCEHLTAVATVVELRFCVKIYMVFNVAQLLELLGTEEAPENLVAASSHTVHDAYFLIIPVLLNLRIFSLSCLCLALQPSFEYFFLRLSSQSNFLFYFR